MVWGTIAYNTRSPLVLIRSTMTAQRYVHDIQQPHVLQLMQWLPGTIFQRDNARLHTARVSQLSPPLYYPSLACPIPRFVSSQAYLGSFGMVSWVSTSLNELEARLQQIWNEMSQDIIQNLYASIPDRIASC
ncbi:uncharacterized protein TNCV_2882871 [Trichonephila clavipes]|nr:uncharacterized protein TNCV_2882871 [Trichonephila clavipes]